MSHGGTRHRPRRRPGPAPGEAYAEGVDLNDLAAELGAGVAPYRAGAKEHDEDGPTRNEERHDLHLTTDPGARRGRRHPGRRLRPRGLPPRAHRPRGRRRLGGGGRDRPGRPPGPAAVHGRVQRVQRGSRAVPAPARRGTVPRLLPRPGARRQRRPRRCRRAVAALRAAGPGGGVPLRARLPHAAAPGGDRRPEPVRGPAAGVRPPTRCSVVQALADIATIAILQQRSLARPRR